MWREPLYRLRDVLLKYCEKYCLEQSEVKEKTSMVLVVQREMQYSALCKVASSERTNCSKHRMIPCLARKLVVTIVCDVSKAKRATHRFWRPDGLLLSIL